MGCGSSAPVGGASPEEGLQLVLPQAKATSASIVKQDSTSPAPKTGGGPEVVVDIVERLSADRKVRGAVVLHCAGLSPEQKKGMVVAFTPTTPLSGFKYHSCVEDHQQSNDMHSLTASPNGNDVEVMSYETSVTGDVVALGSSTLASDCGNYIKIDATVNINAPRAEMLKDLEVEVPVPANSIIAAWNTTMGKLEVGATPVWAMRRSKPGNYTLTIEVKVANSAAKEEIKKLQPVALRRIALLATTATGVKLKSCTLPACKQAKKSARYMTATEPRTIMVQNGKDGVPVPTSGVPVPPAPAPAPAPEPAPAPAPAAAGVPPQEEGIVVEVRTVRKEIVEVTLAASATVRMLKEAMKERTGVQEWNQRVLGQGKVLDDGQLLGPMVPASGPIRLTWQDKQGDAWGTPAPSTLSSPRAPTGEILQVKVHGGAPTQVNWDSQETVKDLKVRLAPLVNLPQGKIDVFAKNSRLADDAVLGGFPSLVNDPSRTIMVTRELTR
mmetsp:Transcript_39553/g.91325  ORF Transcript_39553/g.91325 Transcript_39553/m.91325 type:complete len:497 (-) Transcript_39553:40-1530(-)